MKRLEAAGLNDIHNIMLSHGGDAIILETLHGTVLFSGQNSIVLKPVLPYSLPRIQNVAM